MSMNRERFPGLNDSWARLDGPAGTQMVDQAIDAMTEWMRSGRSANSHGVFAQAKATDELDARTKATLGLLFEADPSGIVIGPNMTSLTLELAAAVGRTQLRPGDEVVCTRLDHDANVAPWLIAAERAGATVRFADPEPETLELRAEHVAPLLSERTRWVAVTAASNAVGTIPDLPGIIAAAKGAGARVHVDAVHAAPHRRLSVRELGCDVLACSSYKWFGPHAGIQCADPVLLAELRPDKLRPSPDTVPERWERGTPAYETFAGIMGAADYLLGLNWDAVHAHEQALLDRTLEGLDEIDGVTVHGRARERTSTVMFSVTKRTAEEVATALAADEIAVWHGNYYAYELSCHLGLEPSGGAVRAGFVHYNGQDEAERLLASVRRLV